MEIEMTEILRDLKDDYSESYMPKTEKEFEYYDRFSGCLLAKNEVSANGEKRRYGPAPIDDNFTEGGQQFSSVAGSLEATLAEDEAVFDYDEMGRSKAGCNGYISYFSKLAFSDFKEKIDVDFVDSLIRGGADVNVRDKHGQSIMFEIVRQWTTEAAEFALSRGLDIEQADNYGRTPLHLAAALDNPTMTTWLINNGSDIHAKTKGEMQTPIHYATKSNAVHALKILLSHGASLTDRDFKQRTPLFLAAEQGRSMAAHFLVQVNAPVGVYDDCGTSAISVMASKMPDIANIALQQFITQEQSSRKTFYHLNYLETATWRDLAVKKGLPMRNGFVLTLLEVLVKYNELRLIMHPVINRLIHMKWKQFGKWKTVQQVLLNIFYTLLWTTIAIALPNKDGGNVEFYTPAEDRIWILVLEVIACLLTLYFVVVQIINFKTEQLRNARYIRSRTAELERELYYCHPRWPEEKRYVTSETESIRATSSSAYLQDLWNIFEWITYSGIVLLIATRTAAVVSDGDLAYDIHIRAFPIVLILIWLRMMKYFRSFQTLGPFITMLGHVIDATLKFCFLFFEIFIPYICAFWILFNGVEDYKTVSDVTYQVFLMTLVGDYSFTPLIEKDKIMAQVMVGTYIALAAVVCLNLYIALMSETFTRVFSNATANAYMLQAKQLLDIEAKLSASKRSKNHKHMLRHYSPEVVYSVDHFDVSENSQLTDLRMQSNAMMTRLEALHDLCNESAKKMKSVTKELNALSKGLEQGTAYQKRVMMRMRKMLKRMHDNNAQQMIRRGLGLESDSEESSDEEEGVGVVQRIKASSVSNLKSLKDKITSRIKPNGDQTEPHPDGPNHSSDDV